MRRRLKIFFHDNCFDGTASAAVFTDFYLKHRDGGAEIEYQGVQHGPGDPFEGLKVDGDDNACVDFRYDERMSWWFDHHASAFQPPERRAHFEADVSGQKFLDPTAESCTKFLARTLGEQYGYEVPEFLTELIEWADIIDSGKFPSPRTPIDLDQPATQLMTWVRRNEDPRLMHRYIQELRSCTLGELARAPWLREPLEGQLRQHRRNIDLIRERAINDGCVVFVDLTADAVAGYNSFISYYLFPEAPYTVGLVRADDQVRISVGYNAFSGVGRTHNIAAICERFGGGGHAFVGGVSVTGLERGREIADIIRAELRRDGADRAC